MAERELSLNLSEDAKDMLVDKGWDPAMGARPLRRAIQRYIEDPIADEVLRQSMEPGSTVEVDKPGEGEGDDVKITINAPKHRKREAVGVGAKGGDDDAEPEALEPGDEVAELPEAVEVLPDVPDAPPSDADDDKH